MPRVPDRSGTTTLRIVRGLSVHALDDLLKSRSLSGSDRELIAMAILCRFFAKCAVEQLSKRELSLAHKADAYLNDRSRMAGTPARRRMYLVGVRVCFRGRIGWSISAQDVNCFVSWANNSATWSLFYSDLRTLVSEIITAIKADYTSELHAALSALTERFEASRRAAP